MSSNVGNRRCRHMLSFPIPNTLISPDRTCSTSDSLIFFPTSASTAVFPVRSEKCNTSGFRGGSGFRSHIKFWSFILEDGSYVVTKFDISRKGFAGVLDLQSQNKFLTNFRHPSILEIEPLCIASRMRCNMNHAVFWVTPSARCNS